MADNDNIDMLQPSSAYNEMEPYWDLVTALMGGVAAMREQGVTYLPSFPAESATNWAHRNDNSKFTNVYGGILEGLAAKPFSQEVALLDPVPPTFAPLVENIDGLGNHLHVFASELFLNGLNYAVDWVLVDYPVVREGATRADEKRAGARPHWVRIPATDMLAVYSAMIGAEEKIIYARFKANVTVRDGVDEKCLQQVKVLRREQVVTVDGATGIESSEYGPPIWEVWTLTDERWTLTESGMLSIEDIPLVPFAPGRRVNGTWKFKPPLQAIAELQIEHYQQETNLKSAKEQTAFPMFAGNGVSKPKDAAGEGVDLQVGPSAILYSPMSADGHHGTWSVLEISATSLQFLAKEIERTEAQMHELGRQPLLQGSAGITQVAAALTSQQASCALQAWAFQLKDACEQACVYTAMWLKEPTAPSVYVNTDFEVNLGDDKAPEFLLKARDGKVISTRTLRTELKRRSVLSPEFDNDNEDKLLLEEMPGDGEDTQAGNAGVTGDPATGEDADLDSTGAQQ